MNPITSVTGLDIQRMASEQEKSNCEILSVLEKSCVFHYQGLTKRYSAIYPQGSQCVWILAVGKLEMVLDEDECQSKPNQLLTKNMSYYSVWACLYFGFCWWHFLMGHCTFAKERLLNGNLDRVNQIAYTDDWVSNYSFAGL